MSTVALKGKLEFGDDKKWHWKGKWAFGTTIEELPTKTSPKQQPFHYSFESVADPFTIAVPSLVLPPPPSEARKDKVVDDFKDAGSASGARNDKEVEKDQDGTPAENQPRLSPEAAPTESKIVRHKKASVETIKNKASGVEQSHAVDDKDGKWKRNEKEISEEFKKSPLQNEGSPTRGEGNVDKMNEGKEISKPDVVKKPGDEKSSSPTEAMEKAKSTEKETGLTEAEPKKEGSSAYQNDALQNEIISPSVPSSSALDKDQQPSMSPSTLQPPGPLDKSLSFAAVPEGDPDFTDAATKFEDNDNFTKCPTSGKWRGYFQNSSAGRGRGTHRVQERFCLFFNATPGKDASFYFEEVAGSFPPPEIDRVLVRGMGENAFGTFEICGYLDSQSMILEIQRQYVLVQEENTSTTPSTKKRKQRNPTPATIRHKIQRPHFTRKRQPSWKRKSQEEDKNQDESYKRKKRSKSLSVDTSTAATTGDASIKAGMLPSSTASTSDSKLFNSNANTTPISKIRSTLSPDNNATAGGKRNVVATKTPPIKRQRSSSHSGSAGGSSRKRSSSMGTPKLSNQKSIGSTQSPSSAYLKLPPTGDPKKARWRASHFLYYQRHDPDEYQQEQAHQKYDKKSPANSSSKGASNNSSSSTSATSSNNPKYVIYEGEMADSKREGRGICLYSNNMLYEGAWKRNKEHGKGKLMTSDRTRIIYEGEFERGKIQGHGTYYYAQVESSDFSGDGARYIGEFKENMRNGFGKYVLPDGSVYNGMWREGTMNGKGVFTWPDKSFYDGEWKDGNRNGQGLLKTSDGFIYDGMWVNNSMEGRGSAVYPNGQNYEGLFFKGRREGRGTMHFSNGAVYEGRFRDDAVDGQGTMKMARAIVVPSKNAGDKNNFMIPISFQSDMGHIHSKAGFTATGD
jgi:hypothetical protein